MKRFEKWFATQPVPQGHTVYRIASGYGFHARDAEVQALVEAGRWFYYGGHQDAMNACACDTCTRHAATLAAYEGKEKDNG